jgi:hypothetical protein
MRRIRVKGHCRAKQILNALVLSLCAFFMSKPSAALEPLRVFRGALVLEGKIESGDYISLRNFLRDESNFAKITGGVFLASQGGSVGEALKIGSLIRALQLTTDAPASPPAEARAAGSPIIRGTDLKNPRHYQCASACFLVYVGGADRRLIWAGRLGIHQPRIEHKPVGATDDDVLIATGSAHIAIRNYFARMNVPEKYLDIMYSVPPNEVRWLTQAEFDQDLKGYVPELRVLLENKCKFRSSAVQTAEMLQCIRQVRAQLSNAAWRSLFQRDNCTQTNCSLMR